MVTLAVIVHRHDPLDGARYLPWVLAPYWRDQGLTITVVRDPPEFVPADAALLHVDLTRVPAAYRRLAARYPRVINGGAIDIAKRRFSDRRVWPWSADGPVIVKSNRNHGGLPERLKAAHGLARRLAAIGDRLPWWFSGRFPDNDYPTFTGPRAVPWATWLNPRLIVERLINEREGDVIVVRRWIFVGAREINIVDRGRMPRSGRAGRISRAFDAAVPETLRPFRARFGLDMGKIDYAIVDGRVVVYDVNRTPNMAWCAEPEHAAHRAHLAAGIWDLLAPGR